MSLPPLHSFDKAPIETIAALPNGGNGAGLIIIDDGLMPTERMASLCDDFAHEGYIALNPRLINVEDAAPDPEKSVRDLLAVLAYMRKLPGCGGKVGVLGFGFGGLLAFLMASRCDVDCAVGYGCNGIGPYADEVFDIRRPVLLHLGVPEAPQEAAQSARLIRSLKRSEDVTPLLYDGVSEGFFRIEQSGFNAEAARAAHQQTMAFLAEHLNG
ncbi:MAG TPA: hypothetical protein DCY07_02045 [Rhodospirillaceae bacterium]|nr:hypothetical protein [Rhodospirillaceae bacterium]